MKFILCYSLVLIYTLLSLLVYYLILHLSDYYNKNISLYRLTYYITLNSFF